MTPLSPFLVVVVLLAFAALLVSLTLSFVRVIRGPTLPDRVAALELVNVLTVSFIALYTVWSGQVAFIDAAAALALIAFVSTVAFARYAERGGGQ
ncbi:monovalent cation/H+ antiporter complex subunit F [Truepera radiovictrix]|uniref:Multiple resistance and pH regulation protein F n=1 Tax=Truepera radiovictrix (strain DSM 17093 / CIP 108686 / LMG 22925 / RQ-24) TaxID=649638 RepID=D7CUJ4_TRURR|nr:monovalent cation/H+ antiporter complex subunit F [Truepera radiovictrix]ADI15779.1 multiple resistance and pH regulation protein F [Truepera radiovictrix DSM 17093]WMT58594.1 monovalent cation/H+ antiporter complex subunit F [Truepera radiovictrix]